MLEDESRRVAVGGVEERMSLVEWQSEASPSLFRSGGDGLSEEKGGEERRGGGRRRGKERRRGEWSESGRRGDEIDLEERRCFVFLLLCGARLGLEEK